ncbi:hypothetical protein PGB90_006458 [Kerria lacca]
MGKTKNPFAFLNSEIYVKDERVLILHHKHGTVHLLGTNHNRENSAAAVEELIRMVKPHVVAVELCRTNLERYSETKNRLPDEDNNTPKCLHDMEMIPARLKNKAIGEELLLALIIESIKFKERTRDKPLTELILRDPKKCKFKLKPKMLYDVVIGKEMTVPFGNQTWYLQSPNSLYLINKNKKYKIMLADKPVEETFSSIASSLSKQDKDIIEVYQSHFLRLFVSFSTSKSIIMSMMETNAKLYKAILTERDKYLANSVKKAIEETKIKKNEIVRIVGIVGKCHVPGIIKYWNKTVCNSKKPN